MDDTKIGTTPEQEQALEGISVLPPVPGEDDAPAAEPTGDEHPTPEVRDGHDAADDERLKRDPSDADAKLDVELDETFPSSDAPSTTRPGGSSDPAPSSGYDERAERGRGA